jgi:hypothetical protein
MSGRKTAPGRVPLPGVPASLALAVPVSVILVPPLSCCISRVKMREIPMLARTASKTPPRTGALRSPSWMLPRVLRTDPIVSRRGCSAQANIPEGDCELSPRFPSPQVATGAHRRASQPIQFAFGVSMRSRC